MINPGSVFLKKNEIDHTLAYQFFNFKTEYQRFTFVEANNLFFLTQNNSDTR